MAYYFNFSLCIKNEAIILIMLTGLKNFSLFCCDLIFFYYLMALKKAEQSVSLVRYLKEIFRFYYTRLKASSIGVSPSRILIIL